MTLMLIDNYFLRYDTENYYLDINKYQQLLLTLIFPLS